jgi:hypothetical protein
MKINIVSKATFRGPATKLVIAPRQFGPPPGYTWTLTDESGAYRDSGEVSLTQAQWDGWGNSQSDEAYQLACIAANLGLTAV